LRTSASVLVAFLLLPVAVRAASTGAPEEGVEFFERHVRPMLVEQCYKCHSAQAKSLKGELRLDTREGLLRGGESGTPAIVPGDATASRLIESVRYGNPDLQMPPKHRLSEAQVADLVAWVEMGAPDPRTSTGGAPATTTAGKTFWSFQPPRAATEPAVKDAAWVRNPIDAFVLAALEAKNLHPSPEADRRTLIRRATFDLTGLPPTPVEVDAFVADGSPDAYERLVDRLLASPRYGERWGRYWLDLARYSDTKGYVYDRDEREFVHAHAYRDWVIRALNSDLPYDQFLTLQLAADGLRGEPGFDRRDLAAMGFLTLGRRFLGVTHDIIDDRIDTVMRTTQALTVACARCHDHKFDPIPTADYYSLYGVFAASTERLVSLDETPKDTDAYRAYVKGLAERQKKLADTYAAKLAELTNRLRGQAETYLVALLDVEKLETEEFYEIRGPDDLNPVIVRQWQNYLFQAAKGGDPVFAPWHALAALGKDRFAGDAQAALDHLSGANPLVLARLRARRLTSMADVAHAYGQLLTEVDREWRAASAKSPALTALTDADREQLRQVLYGPGAPVNVPPGSIADTEWFFDEGTRVTLAKLQAEIDRWNIKSPAAPDHALILEDRPAAAVHNPRIFRRGNPANKGPEVPRQYLAILAGPSRKPFEHGSGRLDMARLIASRDNPLTARVMVNRIWQHHFGEGIARTPSDFGARCQPPTHPELLDWLAVRFMDGGWSMKAIHRLIMTSATYRQSSADDALAAGIDPENKLLWRMSRTRLDFEALRDALLATSGELDLTVGGRPVAITGNRRTVYAKVDRQYLPGLFRTFDFANPDLHVPQRSTTTVPQQALFLMNNDFVAERAKAMVARPEVRAATPDAERVRCLYRLAYQREPTSGQTEAALEFVRTAEREPASSLDPWARLAHVLLISNEFAFVD
jgi:cytochrome c553